MSFILKLSTSILTEKLQSHLFIVTETLNSDKYMTSPPLWVKRCHRGLQTLKICRQKKSHSVYTMTMWY